MQFLHAADIHLDSPLRGLERYQGAPVDEIRGATRRAFDALIALAIDEQVAFVLLAGDLFDGDWKDYNSGLYLVERMVRLQRAGVRVFMVAGNHDADSRITRHLQLPDNVTVLATGSAQTVDLAEFGVALHGQGFATAAVTEDLSREFPPALPGRFNIGLLHTSLNGRPGHHPYAPCSVDGLRSLGYDYWALGHVHQREVVSETPWIVFPGNLQGRHSRETGAKGATLVSVDDGQVQGVEHRALDVLRWARCEVALDGVDEHSELLERVRATLAQAVTTAAGRPLAVRLSLSGETALHAALHGEAEHWMQQLRAEAIAVPGPGLWLERLVIDTRPCVGRDAVGERDDALGGLLRELRSLQLGDARLARLADALKPLRSKLPQALLQAEDGLDPCAPAELQAALEDVRELLIGRLLRADDG